MDLHASLAARYSHKARQVQTKPLVSPRVALALHPSSGKHLKKKESFSISFVITIMPAYNNEA
jgi:hypothetical protein